jgi:hypothetical protein
VVQQQPRQLLRGPVPQQGQPMEQVGSVLVVEQVQLELHQRQQLL